MLILASKSVARNALLAGTGLRFVASPAQIDERAVEAAVLGKGGGAVEVARRLAEAKALTVAATHPGALVIGADQVLAVSDNAASAAASVGSPSPLEGEGARRADEGFASESVVARRYAPNAQTPSAHPSCGASRHLLPQGEKEGQRGASSILHKPIDMAQAARQLDRLRGRTHHLHSGIALARDGVVLWSEVETASLTMRAFSADERDAVLALEGEAVLASVGAYRLEGPSIRLFERIEGDYFTILGLPLLPLLAALRRHAPELLPE
ncbi:Maf family protein [Devosia sp.]|uniref:Maf family protein n=1 Tax=Devosia sp. TaxID=1871048 RepID=UPI001AD1EF20|nr:Maf family protein [Devosia sp.]MBN9309484.1 Maf family protein [Devosia sp.]